LVTNNEYLLKLHCQTYYKSLLFLIGIVFIWVGCQTSNQKSNYPYLKITNPLNITVSNLKGEAFNWENLNQNKVTVFIFISPECPLCENYSVTFNALKKEYGDKQVQLIGIVPGKYYSVQQIDSFLNKYQINIEVLMDTEYAFCNYFEAKVTPEVFVLNAKSETIYHGKIDNWIHALGIKRSIVNKFYLKDAIEAILNKTELNIKKTEAIGCIIE